MVSDIGHLNSYKVISVWPGMFVVEAYSMSYFVDDNMFLKKIPNRKELEDEVTKEQM